MLCRRTFLSSCATAVALAAKQPAWLRADDEPKVPRSVSLQPPQADEDIFSYLQRTSGGFNAARYKQILGAANPFKEGDQIIGVAAADDASRTTARQLLAATR